MRLTVRTRLTLLYAGLFAVCGAIVVAVSYTLVAGLGASGQEQGKSRAAFSQRPGRLCGAVPIRGNERPSRPARAC